MGGTEVLLSTNPIAIAVPGWQHPSIVLDMATTNTAFGKIRLKAQRNEPMPEGWMNRPARAALDRSEARERRFSWSPSAVRKGMDWR